MQREEERKAIKEAINLIESIECEVLSIRDDLEAANNHLWQATSLLEELLHARATADTSADLPLQAQPVIEPPEARVIEVCQEGLKPKAKPSNKVQEREAAKERSRA
jgi:hypothetical protein